MAQSHSQNDWLSEIGGAASVAQRNAAYDITMFGPVLFCTTILYLSSKYQEEIILIVMVYKIHCYILNKHDYSIKGHNSSENH